MLTINFSPFPYLESNRLLFRPVDGNDVDAVLQLRGNSETMKFIPRPLLKTPEEAMEHIAMIQAKIESNEGINWAITLKGSPKLVGVIGHYRIKPEHYRAEIGYMLLPEFHGKGIITEGIDCVLDYGFNVMQLHSVEAVIDPKNAASECVLLKNGFVKEAHLLENECYNGVFTDSVIYSLLKRNYRVMR